MAVHLSLQEVGSQIAKSMEMTTLSSNASFAVQWLYGSALAQLISVNHAIRGLVVMLQFNVLEYRNAH